MPLLGISFALSPTTACQVRTSYALAVPLLSFVLSRFLMDTV